MTKRDDLAAHQSGTLMIEVLTPSEEHIQLIGGVAIVNVRMHISGSYAGVSSESDFRFTRVWVHTSGGSCPDYGLALNALAAYISATSVMG